MAQVRQLAALAHEWNLELNQLALAYALGLSGMGPVIPGASTVAQLESNACAAHVQLSDEQRRQVQAVVGQH